MGPFLDWLARGFARMRSMARGIFRRSQVEREMRDEFRHHIDLRTDDLVRQGVSPREARRTAHREFGHAETHRDGARASRGLKWLDQLRFSWIDVKLGARMLVARPGLTLVSIFALSLGIPIGMAPLHFANAVEAPLPEDPENRVRALRFWDPATATVAAPREADFEHWRDGSTSFEALAAVRTAEYNLGSGEGPAAPVRAALLSASLFEVLQTAPALGRTLSAADQEEGAEDVVLLGHDVWRARFGADPGIVGTSVVVGGGRYTVVGVMPEGFYFPSRQQLWLPLRLPSRDAADPGRSLRVVGRLADGVEADQAQGEIDALGVPEVTRQARPGGRLAPEVVPYGYAGAGVPRAGMSSMPEFFLSQLVAIILLLVACTNVAMLTFARTATRFREVAVRSALGASRIRIVMQIFVETQLLAMLSAGVGLLVVDRLLVGLQAWLLGYGLVLPYWLPLGVTPEAVIWAMGLATLSATVAGVVPALRITGLGVQDALRRVPGSRSGIRFGGVTGVLIAMDVAVSVTVLAFAFSLTDYLRFQVGTDELVGIPAEEYLAVDLRLPPTTSEGGDVDADVSRLGSVQTALVERLRGEPEVRAVAVAEALPRMDHRSGMIEVEGVEPPQGRPGRWVRTVRVDVDFLRELEQPLRAGRDFSRADTEHDGPRPVLVNTALVDDLLGGADAVGRRLRFVTAGTEEEAQWREVVGVVGSLGISIADPNDDPGVYMPAAPGEIHPVRLGIRVGEDPEAFVPRLREITQEVEPSLVMGTPMALDRAYPVDWYLMIAITGGLTLLVLVLVAVAASGIYAIVSFSVSERTREIGVRSALGAPRHQLVWAVLNRALLQIGAGALFGVPVAAWVLSGTLGGPDGQAVVVSSALAIALGVGVVAVVAVGSFTLPMRRLLDIRASDALRDEG